MEGPKAVREQAPTFYSITEDEHDPRGASVANKWRGTSIDRREMNMLGKIQELKRNFGSLSIVGLACCLIATWEVLLTTITSSLTNGGLAGLFWGYVGVAFGFTFVYLSLAEMASMMPTSSGQYHWVSELAPGSAQKLLSYIVGWLCATGWLGAITSICFLAGTIIQGLMILNGVGFAAAPWVGTVSIIVIDMLAVLFNTLLAKKLPAVEVGLLIMHVVGLFAIISPLWVFSPTTNAHDVFFEFSNAGGWSSNGLAVMVGLLSPIISLIGFDCAVHMSEETEDASYSLPRAIIWAFGVNAISGLIMVLTICFTLGNVTEILGTTTGYPFIQIFYNATNSYAGTNIMTAIIILTLTSSAISEIATASRQLWSFARDKGLPGHRWIAHVNTRDIPLNAIMVSFGVTILLSLINLGSTIALFAVLSLTIASLLSSYLITISVLLGKRIRGEPLPARRWNLGRCGLPINVIAIGVLLLFFVFAFFPAVTPVEAASMNWAIVMFGGIMGFAAVYYFAHGRREYLPPVALVKREEFECK